MPIEEWVMFVLAHPTAEWTGGEASECGVNSSHNCDHREYLALMGQMSRNHSRVPPPRRT